MTSIVTGATPERFDIVKWFYIEADDDTDYDAAADVIAPGDDLPRPFNAGRGTRRPATGRARPAGPPDRALLRDLDAVLGNERVPAADRLLNQVDERRHPRTSATVDQLLDLHFELATLEPTTRSTYIGYANKHIRPLIGGVKAGVLDADVFDSFYAELRRWREHCDRRPFTQHRTTVEHTCDDRCRPHVCTPLGASTINSVSVARLGINSTFHKLRHYSATELISAGVDARTVAGNGLDPLEQPAKIGSKTTAIAHVLNHRVSPRAAPRARRQPSSSCVVGYQRKR